MAAASVAEAFSKAQTSAAQHRRCALKLRRAQGADLSPEFESAFQAALTHIVAANSTASATKRLIHFVACTCSELDGNHNDSLGLVVLGTLLPLSGCKDRHVRANCCLIVAEVLKNLSDTVEFEDTLWEQLVASMIQRSMDKIVAVRLAATGALERLQDATSDECEVTAQLVQLSKCDPSAQMRCAALKSVVKTDWTLGALLLRTKDADAAVRVTALREFERCVSPGALPLDTRERLLAQGMRDRDESVRNACLSLMCAWAASVSWDAAAFVALFPMPQAEQHVVALLFKLYAQALTAPPPSNNVTTRQALPCFSDGFLLPAERAGAVDVNATAESQIGPRDRWLGLQKLCSFTPWSSGDESAANDADSVSGAAVSVAAVAAWQARCTWLRSQGSLPAAQRKLTPGAAEELLDALAPSLTSVCRMLLDVMDAAQTSSGDAPEHLAADTNGLLLQLVRLGQACDSSDSVGAAHMQKLMHSLLVHRLDDSAEASSLPVLALALYGDATGEEAGSTEVWLGGSGLHQRTGLGTHIPGGQLTQACVDLLFAVSHGEVRKVTDIACSSVLELAGGSSAELARALHIFSHFLATSGVPITADGVMDAVQTVVVPALSSDDEATKTLAVRCVALVGLLPQSDAEATSCSDDFTAMHVSTLGECMQQAASPVLELVAMQGAVDWLCTLSPSCMALSADLVKVGDLDASFGQLALQHLWDRGSTCSSSPACALAIEGLCTLLFRGRMPQSTVSEQRVISLLLAAYCVPAGAGAEEGGLQAAGAGAARMRFKQCLATFLPNLAMVAQENRNLLAKALPGAIGKLLTFTVAGGGDSGKAVHLLADFSVFLLGIEGSAVTVSDALPSAQPVEFVAAAFAHAAATAVGVGVSQQCAAAAVNAMGQQADAAEDSVVWLQYIAAQLHELETGTAKHDKLVQQLVRSIHDKAGERQDEHAMELISAILAPNQ